MTSRTSPTAREKILAAATELFPRQGINATGMDQLTRVAGVSKRTVYLQFATKDDLVTEYLRAQQSTPPAAGATAREQLLAIFDPSGRPGPVRGCVFLNAAVEVPDPEHPAHVVVRQEKLAVAARLAELARQAGARDPEQLGEQLALLYDGAASRAVALDDPSTADTARTIAAALIDTALFSGDASVPLVADSHP
jgi:AcrR family transcriptional regulator